MINSVNFTALSFIPYIGVNGLKIVAVLAVFLIFGLTFGVASVSLQVAFVSNVEETHLARAGSIFNSTATAAMPVASLLLTIMSTFLGITDIFVIFGVGCWL